ncbi:hypothetical protein GCM10028796_54100 [Ramlibacter monticola]|uniref:Uncharacterized protein n=1 Tax=Ramlibacter monticola TaxID=1926872 RepID=A0A936YYS0_9BURK|nr:hypothetical protein [Ramlibacter monticola]MBL0391704.1 hypothetical protein [Ramlibacter monticola]
MDEQVNTPDGTPAQAAQQPSAPLEVRRSMRTASEPRELAPAVMARMQHVRSRRDQMTTAVDDLGEIVQELTRAYVRQVLLIENLRGRVKALEEAARDDTDAPSIL